MVGTCRRPAALSPEGRAESLLRRGPRDPSLEFGASRAQARGVVLHCALMVQCKIIYCIAPKSCYICEQSKVHGREARVYRLEPTSQLRNGTTGERVRARG